MKLSERRSNNKIKKFERDKRKEMAAEMYLRHMSQAEIAKALGVSRSVVCDYIQENLAEFKRERIETTEQWILRELAELDRMEKFALEKLEATGDPKWYEMQMKAKDRRTKYLGLDKGDKQEITVITPEFEQKIKEKFEAIIKKNQEQN